MKVLLKSLCVGFIVSILLSLVSFEGECREISEQVFRIHILANSDSEEDQDLGYPGRGPVQGTGKGTPSRGWGQPKALSLLTAL